MAIKILFKNLISKSKKETAQKTKRNVESETNKNDGLKSKEPGSKRSSLKKGFKNFKTDWDSINIELHEALEQGYNPEKHSNIHNYYVTALDKYLNYDNAILRLLLLIKKKVPSIKNEDDLGSITNQIYNSCITRSERLTVAGHKKFWTIIAEDINKNFSKIKFTPEKPPLPKSAPPKRSPQGNSLYSKPLPPQPPSRKLQPPAKPKTPNSSKLPNNENEFIKQPNQTVEPVEADLGPSVNLNTTKPAVPRPSRPLKKLERRPSADAPSGAIPTPPPMPPAGGTSTPPSSAIPPPPPLTQKIPTPPPSTNKTSSPPAGRTPPSPASSEQAEKKNENFLDQIRIRKGIPLKAAGDRKLTENEEKISAEKKGDLTTLLVNAMAARRKDLKKDTEDSQESDDWED